MRGLKVLLFGCILCLAAVFSAPCRAQNYIQSFESGRIDWSNGIVEAEALGEPPKNPDNIAQARAMAESEAVSRARHNLTEIVSRVRVDSKTLIRDYMDKNQDLRKKILVLLKDARVVDLVYNEDGSVKATVAIEFGKEFIELLIPASIRHIEPIKTSSNTSPTTRKNYTGLIVDCRGIAVESALVMRIVDEDDHTVYGPAYVSRGFAVKQGMAGYMKDYDAAKNHPRVAVRPLTIKGLRTEANTESNIVISNADAARIRGTASNLSFLQKCKVVIVLE